MNGTSWPKADEAGFSSLEPRFVKTTKWPHPCELNSFSNTALRSPKQPLSWCVWHVAPPRCAASSESSWTTSINFAGVSFSGCHFLKKFSPWRSHCFSQASKTCVEDVSHIVVDCRFRLPFRVCFFKSRALSFLYRHQPAFSLSRLLYRQVACFCRIKKLSYTICQLCFVAYYFWNDANFSIFS
jgi:hypothetical protein